MGKESAIAGGVEKYGIESAVVGGKALNFREMQAPLVDGYNGYRTVDIKPP